MKKIGNIFAVLFIVIISVGFNVISVFGYGSVIDYAYLVDEQAKLKADEILTETSRQINAPVYLAVKEGSPSYGYEYDASELFKQMIGIDRTLDGIMLVIWYNPNYVYVVAGGGIEYLGSNGGSKILSDKLMGYCEHKNFLGLANEYSAQILSNYSGKRNPGYGEEEYKSKELLNALFNGIVVGLICAVIFFVSTIRHYRFKKQFSAQKYIDGVPNWRIREDIYVITYETRVKIETNSSNSNGGHGGGYSGSHGGGGSGRSGGGRSF